MLLKCTTSSPLRRVPAASQSSGSTTTATTPVNLGAPILSGATLLSPLPPVGKGKGGKLGTRNGAAGAGGARNGLAASGTIVPSGAAIGSAAGTGESAALSTGCCNDDCPARPI